MPALFVFLLKVNIALLLFCAGYYLVLRPLTFYTLNRIYLLTAIVFASVYPWLNFSAFVQRHEELAKPVQQVVINWQAPVQSLVKPLSEPTYWHWAEVIFWLGAYMLTLKLAVQLFSLYRLYKNSEPATINNHQVRIMDKDAAPFSFWQSIFVNPSKHEPADLKAILLHEQIHVNQWHTADILLAEISSIFYWFNPGIWLMKKAIRENIEFITDRKILNQGFDSKTYQYSLVSVSFNNQQPGIVNHFNISTIKKRIIMMNAKRSSKINLTRYAFLVPAVITLLLIFSISKADFAKPIRVKLADAVKPLQNIVAVTALPNPAGKISFPKPKKLSHQPTKTVLVAKPDTNKWKVRFATKTGSNDSVVYYINGVKGSLKNVDPDDIAQVTVLKGDRVSDLPPFVNQDDVRNAGVVVVVTKDSPEGKVYLKKLDNTSNNGTGTILLTGSLKHSQSNKNSTQVFVSDYKLIPKGSSGWTAVKANSKSAVTTGTNVNVDTSIKANKQFNVLYSFTVDTNTKKPIKAKIIRVSSASNVSVNGKNTASQNISVDNDKGMHISFDKDKTPLIIVDGKEIPATDMKNLNPNNIDSMSVLNGEGATKKYGDKAKDGVILISTKRRPLKD